MNINFVTEEFIGKIPYELKEKQISKYDVDCDIIYDNKKELRIENFSQMSDDPYIFNIQYLIHYMNSNYTNIPIDIHYISILPNIYSEWTFDNIVDIIETIEEKKEKLKKIVNDYYNSKLMTDENKYITKCNLLLSNIDHMDEYYISYYTLKYINKIQRNNEQTIYMKSIKKIDDMLHVLFLSYNNVGYTDINYIKNMYIRYNEALIEEYNRELKRLQSEKLDEIIMMLTHYAVCETTISFTKSITDEEYIYYGADLNFVKYLYTIDKILYRNIDNETWNIQDITLEIINGILKLFGVLLHIIPTYRQYISSKLFGIYAIKNPDDDTGNLFKFVLNNFINNNNKFIVISIDDYIQKSIYTIDESSFTVTEDVIKYIYINELNRYLEFYKYLSIEGHLFEPEYHSISNDILTLIQLGYIYEYNEDDKIYYKSEIKYITNQYTKINLYDINDEGYISNMFYVDSISNIMEKINEMKKISTDDYNLLVDIYDRLFLLKCNNLIFLYRIFVKMYYLDVYKRLICIYYMHDMKFIDLNDKSSSLFCSIPISELMKLNLLQMSYNTFTDIYTKLNVDPINYIEYKIKINPIFNLNIYTTYIDLLTASDILSVLKKSIKWNIDDQKIKVYIEKLNSYPILSILFPLGDLINSSVSNSFYDMFIRYDMDNTNIYDAALKEYNIRIESLNKMSLKDYNTYIEDNFDKTDKNRYIISNYGNKVMKMNKKEQYKFKTTINIINIIDEFKQYIFKYYYSFSIPYNTFFKEDDKISSTYLEYIKNRLIIKYSYIYNLGIFYNKFIDSIKSKILRRDKYDWSNVPSDTLNKFNMTIQKDNLLDEDIIENTWSFIIYTKEQLYTYWHYRHLIKIKQKYQTDDISKCCNILKTKIKTKMIKISSLFDKEDILREVWIFLVKKWCTDIEFYNYNNVIKRIKFKEYIDNLIGIDGRDKYIYIKCIEVLDDEIYVYKMTILEGHSFKKKLISNIMNNTASVVMTLFSKYKKEYIDEKNKNSDIDNIFTYSTGLDKEEKIDEFKDKKYEEYLSLILIKYLKGMYIK